MVFKPALRSANVRTAFLCFLVMTAAGCTTESTAGEPGMLTIESHLANARAVAANELGTATWVGAVVYETPGGGTVDDSSVLIVRDTNIGDGRGNIVSYQFADGRGAGVELTYLTSGLVSTEHLPKAGGRCGFCVKKAEIASFQDSPAFAEAAAQRNESLTSDRLDRASWGIGATAWSARIESQQGSYCLYARPDAARAMQMHSWGGCAFDDVESGRKGGSLIQPGAEIVATATAHHDHFSGAVKVTVPETSTPVAFNLSVVAPDGVRHSLERLLVPPLDNDAILDLGLFAFRGDYDILVRLEGGVASDVQVTWCFDLTSGCFYEDLGSA